MTTAPLNLFPQRVAIGTVQGNSVHMTPEFYRALHALFQRVGGADGGELSQFLGETMGQAVNADDIAAIAQMVGLEANQLFVQETLLPPSIEQEFRAADTAAEIIQQPLMDSSPLPFRAVTVTASPMTIRADKRCAIHITGSTILSYSRAGKSLDVTGSKIIEMNLGDSIRIEYTAAPTITLIPR